MIPRPPGSTPTDPLFPYPTRFRSYRCEDRDIERVELGDGQDVRTARTAIFADRHRALGDDAVDRATHRLFGQDALRAEIFELRSEEHTSELQSLMRISYAVFCLKKKTIKQEQSTTTTQPTNPPTATPP